MEVLSIRTPSLGDATYIAVHAGHAVISDPQRDIGRFVDELEDRDLTLTHVLETHMHNDYISGGRDLAAARGADLVLPAAAGAGFFFVPAFHREDLEGADGLVIRPLHTPGHTPEHMSFLFLVDDEEQAVFTGGSLLVGAAGRSDLLGDQYARQLARLQYGSLQRLARLPDDTGVYPTHGEGSFCTSSGAGRTTSTIGREKAENPLFQHPDAETFADDQLAVLVPFPSYYAQMGPINKQDPSAVDIDSVPELSADRAASLLDEGAVALDGRSRFRFADGHIPGALGVERGDSFAPWSGWLLEFDAPIVMVLEEGDDAADAAIELARIGFTDVRGVLRGMDEWIASGRDTTSHATASIDDLAARLEDEDLQVLDVRDPQEWASGHIDGAVHRYVPDLREGPPKELDLEEPVWVVCRTGNRSSIAAGLLERHGIDPVVVAEGGVPDLLTSA